MSKAKYFDRITRRDDVADAKRYGVAGSAMAERGRIDRIFLSLAHNSQLTTHHSPLIL